MRNRQVPGAAHRPQRLRGFDGFVSLQHRGPDRDQHEVRRDRWDQIAGFGRSFGVDDHPLGPGLGYGQHVAQLVLRRGGEHHHSGRLACLTAPAEQRQVRIGVDQGHALATAGQAERQYERRGRFAYAALGADEHYRWHRRPRFSAWRTGASLDLSAAARAVGGNTPRKSRIGPRQVWNVQSAKPAPLSLMRRSDRELPTAGLRSVLTNW